MRQEQVKRLESQRHLHQLPHGRGARARSHSGAGLIAAALLLCAGPAHAHEVGLSRGDYQVEGSALRVDVVFARKELAGLVATLDADHDGALTKAEVDAARDAIQGALVGRFKVTGDGAPCAGTLDRAELTEQDGVAVRALYRCARRPAEVTVELAFFADVPFGHRHLARAAAAAGPLDLVLSQRAPSFSFNPPAAAPDAPPPVDPTASPVLRGARHVATSWALPVFLLGLLAPCAARRPALLTAAAFAAAVAVGLALAGLGVFVPSPRVLGSALALSLAFVGFDNLAPPVSRRPWIALPFGLVHGLGCGVASGAVSGAVAALAPFSLGVAAGLAVLLAALVPAVLWLRARPGFAPRGVAALSAAVALAGVVGFGLHLR
jgi:hypothetical protein